MGRQIKGMRAFSVAERKAIRAALIEKYGLICQICKAQGKLDLQCKIRTDDLYEDDSFSVDHILALADGGTNTLDNMWPTHIACNERKGSRSQGGRVRSNRRPRTAVPSQSQPVKVTAAMGARMIVAASRKNVTQATTSTLVYSSEPR